MIFFGECQRQVTGTTYSPALRAGTYKRSKHEEVRFNRQVGGGVSTGTG